MIVFWRVVAVAVVFAEAHTIHEKNSTLFMIYSVNYSILCPEIEECHLAPGENLNAFRLPVFYKEIVALPDDAIGLEAEDKSK